MDSFSLKAPFLWLAAPSKVEAWTAGGCGTRISSFCQGVTELTFWLTGISCMYTDVSIWNFVFNVTIHYWKSMMHMTDKMIFWQCSFQLTEWVDFVPIICCCLRCFLLGLHFYTLYVIITQAQLMVYISQKSTWNDPLAKFSWTKSNIFKNEPGISLKNISIHSRAYKTAMLHICSVEVANYFECFICMLQTD